MSNENNWHTTSASRRDKVKRLLSDGHWHGTVEICAVQIGGSEGCRRLRELRKSGATIEKRKAKNSTQYEYRLL